MRRTCFILLLNFGLCILPPLATALDMAGLVLYMNFNEGRGNTATDLSGNGNNGTLMGTVSAPMGEWHHFAATYDGTKYDIFIDGVLIDSYDRISPGAIDQDDNPLTIGRDSRGCCNTRNSLCTIDEAAVFSRALNEDGIAEVMSGGFLAVEAKGKLAACWSIIKSR